MIQKYAKQREVTLTIHVGNTINMIYIFLFYAETQAVLQKPTVHIYN